MLSIVCKISLALFGLAIQRNSFVTGDAFGTNCAQLNGTKIGGQCFFIGSAGTNWTSAWIFCQQKGATLAQIQTESEYTSIKQLIRAKSSGSVSLWIALQRDNKVVGQPCSITNDTAYWYDNVTKPNLQMKAGNTWIRCRTCDDHDIGGEYCVHFAFWSNNFVFVFADAPCTITSYPLCQLTNPYQNYTRTNTCLAETPIASFTASRPQDCCDACARTIWCRSFNFVIETNTCANSCQLFTWSVLDQGSCYPMTTTQIASGTECHHYNYDP